MELRHIPLAKSQPARMSVRASHSGLFGWEMGWCELVVHALFRVRASTPETQRWRASVTRCDVFVDCRQERDVAMAGVARPSRWSTWWALDGGDSRDVLTALEWAVHH